MRLLTYINNVVTGRFAHWNEANNQAIAAMWERSEHFPDQTKIPLQEFIVCCVSLMDVLLGPDKGRQRLIKRDPLQVTREQYARIHAIILESITGLFVQINPTCFESIFDDLEILTRRNPKHSRIIQLTEATDKPDVLEIGAATWQEIVAIAESPQGTTAVDAYPFATVLGSLASDTFREVKDKLARMP